MTWWSPVLVDQLNWRI